MKESLMVPHDRKRVINKAVRDKILRELDVKVEMGDNAAELEGEGLKLLQAKNIVLAIARGFSPPRAYRLLDEEIQLDVIELGPRAQRIKSRIIGSKGRTREEIEKATGAAVSIYGKTVSIIGNWEQAWNAKKAVNMIIEGAMHKTVYRFLEGLRN